MLETDGKIKKKKNKGKGMKQQKCFVLFSEEKIIIHMHSHQFKGLAQHFLIKKMVYILILIL